MGEEARRRGRPLTGRLPKDQTVRVRTTDAGVQAIDDRRGSWSRSEYVRQALTMAMKANLRGPGA